MPQTWNEKCGCQNVAAQLTLYSEEVCKSSEFQVLSTWRETAVLEASVNARHQAHSHGLACLVDSLTPRICREAKIDAPSFSGALICRGDDPLSSALTFGNATPPAP